jgi:hypothetical protein
MAEAPHRIIVDSPARSGGRRVRVGDEVLGVAYGEADVLDFARRAGVDTDDISGLADSDLIDWHGGGPDVWM